MHTAVRMSRINRVRFAAFALGLAVLVVAARALPEAQVPAKKAMTISDYTRWRSIASQEMSADGKWVAYTLQLTNTTPPEAKPVLHLLNLETSAEVTVADATGGVFSADSRWIAYQVDPGAAQRARANRSASAPAETGAPATPPAPTPAGSAGAPSGQGGRGGAPQAIPPRRVELRNLVTGEVRSWQEIGTFAF